MSFIRNYRGSIIALVSALAAVALTADGGPNHQVSSQDYGTSGGNVNDISRAFCCSGTLGALVADGTTQYILSNNHLLARSDQADIDEDVSQPGLIDNGCQAAEIVADLVAHPSLGSSNVDAAIATLRAGTMNSTGNILDIGVPATTTVMPAVGLGVAKSGRTTGFTTGRSGRSTSTSAFNISNSAARARSSSCPTRIRSSSTAPRSAPAETPDR